MNCAVCKWNGRRGEFEQQIRPSFDTSRQAPRADIPFRSFTPATGHSMSNGITTYASLAMDFVFPDNPDKSDKTTFGTEHP